MSNIAYGTIVLWSNKSNSVPKDWYICNGRNNTPDLTNVFVKGATKYDNSYTKDPGSLNNFKISDPKNLPSGDLNKCDNYCASVIQSCSQAKVLIKTDDGKNIPIGQGSLLPAYIKLYYIMYLPKNKTYSISDMSMGTIGTIVLWPFNQDIPTNWILCDIGTDTPIGAVYVYGTSDDSELLKRGGSSSYELKAPQPDDEDGYKPHYKGGTGFPALNWDGKIYGNANSGSFGYKDPEIYPPFVKMRYIIKIK